MVYDDVSGYRCYKSGYAMVEKNTYSGFDITAIHTGCWWSHSHLGLWMVVKGITAVFAG